MNLRIWDTKSTVNIRSIEHNFAAIRTEKHVARFFVNKHNQLEFDRNVKRHYVPCDDAIKVINIFKELTSPPVDSMISLKAQRITCSSCDYGYPSIDNWKNEEANEIGIFCVSRKNIIGGFNEFRNTDDKIIQFSEIIEPGHILTFKEHNVEHRVTYIASKDMIDPGCRDVLIMSW